MNIASLNKHKDDLLNYLQNYNPLILCLTETCVNDEFADDELNIRGYCMERCNSCSRHTGGVIVYVKNSLKISNIKKYCIDMNFWILSLNISHKHIKYSIAVLYRSPSGNLSVFFENFSNWVEEFVQINGKHTIIIAGDFNIQYNRDNYEKNRLQKLIQNNGMKQLVNEFTRIVKDSSSIIDLVISNNFHLLPYTEKNYIITDHHILHIEMGKGKEETETIKIRSKIKYDEITQILIEKEWGYSYSNVDVVTGIFLENIAASLDIVSPMRIINVKTSGKKWFDDECKLAIRERNNNYKRFALTGADVDWVNFKRARNRAVKVINNAKTNFFVKFIDDNKRNPKLMWKHLKEIISPKTSKPIESLNCGGIIYNDTTTIVNVLNQYFVNSIEEIINSIDSSDTNMDEILRTLPNQTSNISKFEPLKIQELYNIVKTQRKKYSIDGIGLEIITNLFHIIGYPLLNLINLSLSKGQVPTMFKTSLIVPIPKINNTNLAEELRPVNMLPFCNKILELAVYNQIIQYINNNNILSPYQSGFREHHSCESTLQLVMSDIKEALDKPGVGVCAVFIDMKRAFETLDRQILLAKLRRYGFSGTVLSWISSYLTNRYQVTSLNKITSDTQLNNWGVPQGSVLGPLLFLVYINDMGSVLHKCKIHLFADDTLIYYYGDNFTDILFTLNIELDELFQRFRMNKLKVNESKSKYLFIGNNYLYEKFISSGLQVKINNQNIELVQEIKYLGFIIDRQLKFDKHIDYIAKKIGKKVGFLRRISSSLSIFSRLTVYNTLILPHFSYCSTLIYTGSSNLSRLQILQNKAMRVILGCRRDTSIKSMLTTLNWFNVKKYFFCQTMIFIYKIINNLLPNYLKIKLTPVSNTHNINTRNATSCNFYVNRTQKSSSSKSLFFKGVIEFNSLPREIKDCRSLNIFKKKLKAYVFTL